MSIALIVFLTGAVIFGGLAWVLRGVISALTKLAAEHARVYSVAYIKCGALVAIAVGATFTETFWALTKEEAAAYQWWNWIIVFWKPLAAGLATLIAFMDRSAQTATAKKEADTASGTPSPFASLTPVKPTPVP